MGKISTIDTAFICDNISGSQNAVQIFAKTFTHAWICVNICANKSEKSVGNHVRIRFPTEFPLILSQIFAQIRACAKVLANICAN